MNLGSETVLSKSPDFMDFGLTPVNKNDELGSFFVPTDRVGRSTDGSNWLPIGNNISEDTADKVSGNKAKNNYNFKSEYETRRGEIADHDFGRQNDPTSPPTLDSTHLGTNTTNVTTSPIDLIPVVK